MVASRVPDGGGQGSAVNAAPARAGEVDEINWRVVVRQVEQGMPADDERNAAINLPAKDTAGVLHRPGRNGPNQMGLAELYSTKPDTGPLGVAMNLRQIEAFLAVFEESTFSAGAARLKVPTDRQQAGRRPGEGAGLQALRAGDPRFGFVFRKVILEDAAALHRELVARMGTA